MIKEPLADQLRQVWNHLDIEMTKVPGTIKRIKNCTLKEEWRHGCGCAFDDGDMDNDLFKGMYDYFEDFGRPDDRDQVWDLCKRTNITDLVLATKYPEVYKFYKADQETK